MFPYIDSDLIIGLEETNFHIEIQSGFLFDAHSVSLKPIKKKQRIKTELMESKKGINDK